jgi:acyl-CoA dehydrogenase
MALDKESFDILLPTLQRFIQERLVPAENYLEEHDEVPADIVEDMPSPSNSIPLKSFYNN